jgi:hypothetical protein
MFTSLVLSSKHLGVQSPDATAILAWAPLPRFIPNTDVKQRPLVIPVNDLRVSLIGNRPAHRSMTRSANGHGQASGGRQLTGLAKTIALPDSTFVPKNPELFGI